MGNLIPFLWGRNFHQNDSLSVDLNGLVGRGRETERPINRLASQATDICKGSAGIGECRKVTFKAPKAIDEWRPRFLDSQFRLGSRVAQW